MDPYDVAYKRSVRNMSIVLAAMAITIVAAIYGPPLLFPSKENFQPSVSTDSPFGFALHLQINTTATSGGGVLIRGWLNGTSPGLDNITAQDSWGVGPGGLYTNQCASGWPIGLGVMYGHYDQDNYTLGTLLPLNPPPPHCLPSPTGTPSYFIFAPHSSKALVDIGGTPQYWPLESACSFGYAPGEGLPEGTTPGMLPAGVYTVVLADEWGDVLTTNFAVS